MNANVKKDMVGEEWMTIAMLTMTHCAIIKENWFVAPVFVLKASLGQIVNVATAR